MFLHFHTYVMLRCWMFSCTSTHTSCYASGCSLTLPKKGAFRRNPRRTKLQFRACKTLDFPLLRSPFQGICTKIYSRKIMCKLLQFRTFPSSSWDCVMSSPTRPCYHVFGEPLKSSTLRQVTHKTLQLPHPKYLPTSERERRMESRRSHYFLNLTPIGSVNGLQRGVLRTGTNNISWNHGTSHQFPTLGQFLGLSERSSSREVIMC